MNLAVYRVVFVTNILIHVRLSWTIKIDSHLAVIKNDCYDRLAIGQRLNGKDIYKTFHNLHTVQECQQACTTEKDACKALSFGIGVKGNSTCELGLNRIKESGDLKPIGTITSTDFDLYIKVLGCTLTIDKRPHVKPPGLFQDHLPPKLGSHGYPTQDRDKFPDYLPRPAAYPNKPDTVLKPTSSYHNLIETHNTPIRPEVNYEKPQNEYETHFGNKKPVQDQDYNRPNADTYRPQSIPQRPVDAYQQPEVYHKPQAIPNRPQDPYSNQAHNPNNSNDEIHHVQTTVSISSGPHPLTLHPVHNILMGQAPNDHKPSYNNIQQSYDYGGTNKPIPNNKPQNFLPPFRPHHLQHPYNEEPHYRPSYKQRPNDWRYSDTNHYGQWYEPNSDYEGFDPDRLKYRDYESYQSGFRRPDRETFWRPFYGLYPDRYASYIPHPDEYIKPSQSQFYANNVYPPHGLYQSLTLNNNGQLHPTYSSSYAKSTVNPGHKNRTNNENAYESDPKRNKITNPQNSLNDSKESKKNSTASADKNEKADAAKKNESNSNSIITNVIGAHGETITSIITEIKEINATSYPPYDGYFQQLCR